MSKLILIIILIYLLLGLLATLGAGWLMIIRKGRLPGEKKRELAAVTLLFLPLWPLLLAIIARSHFRSHTCAYCGKPAASMDEMRRHFLTCEKHPMRPVLQAAEALLEETKKIALPEDAALAEVELSLAIAEIYRSAAPEKEASHV